MRIHTSLTREQVTAALPDGVLAYITPHGSRKRERAFEVTLYVTAKDDLHRYYGNSGGYGASEDVAATWDEWGIWIDGIFQRDPNAIVGYYQDRFDFFQKTARERRLVEAYNKPESVRVRTHTAPWLDSRGLGEAAA